jgi:ribosome-associated protein
MTTDEPSVIRLDQFLQVQGIAATGGQAKVLIQSGEVSVNGAVETRRRRQLRIGDVVTFDEDEFVVETSQENGEQET